MPSISGANKIVLKGKYTQGGVECEEGRLLSAAYPGSNLTMTAGADELGRQVYRTGSTDFAGTGSDVTTTKAPLWLLIEDGLIGSTVDTVWPADSNCRLHMCSPGEIVQVLVAVGETVVKGNGLSAKESTGMFRVDTTNAAVIALEGTSGALAANTLVRARVL